MGAPRLQEPLQGRGGAIAAQRLPQGCGGGSPRPFLRLGHFHRIGDAVGDEERIGQLIAAIVDDQQIVNVIGHYHVVADGHRWPYAVHRPQRGLHQLAKFTQLGAALFVGKPRKHRPLFGYSQRDEKELPSASRVF